MLLVLGLGVLMASMPLVKGYYRRSRTFGIVRAADAGLYMGPDKSYPLRATLNCLTEVTIIKKENIWYYTDSAYGKGWLAADVVEITA